MQMGMGIMRIVEVVVVVVVTVIKMIWRGRLEKRKNKLERYEEVWGGF